MLPNGHARGNTKALPHRYPTNYARFIAQAGGAVRTWLTWASVRFHRAIPYHSTSLQQLPLRRDLGRAPWSIRQSGPQMRNAGCGRRPDNRWRCCLRRQRRRRPCSAVDATWVGGNAGDPNEWVEPNNWTPADVPDGIATFTNTGTTTVANDNGVVTIGELFFTLANAQAYTFNINNPFIVNTAGIINNSTHTQTFKVTSGNSLVFQNGSSASGGTGAVPSPTIGGGFINFQNTSTAGNVRRSSTTASCSSTTPATPAAPPSPTTLRRISSTAPRRPATQHHQCRPGR